MVLLPTLCYGHLTWCPPHPDSACAATIRLTQQRYETVAAPHFIPIQTARRPAQSLTSSAPPGLSPGHSGAVADLLPEEATVTVRRAQLGDVPEIKALIDFYAAQNRMLFRARAELYETIREYHVAVHEDAEGAVRVVGASGLHVTWEDLAEVRGLAVAQAAVGRGVGTELVRACLAEAIELGLRQVYTLTLVPEFFGRLGFKRADRDSLHIKVWYECYKCPKFADCDEIAMIRSVGPDQP
ncbi:MAG: hypothetical protein CL878_07760 [Dehalococcoidia bacterium]|nr:hypothetical protein [Dehalococcoidia bacterium]